MFDDHELGVNQDQQAQEFFQTLREQIGSHWSNIQHLCVSFACHYPTMVHLQNSVLSIDTLDAENMVDVLISTLSSQSVPLSGDASAWRVNRIGTSRHDMHNQGGHKVIMPVCRKGAANWEINFNVGRQSDVVVAKTLASFIRDLFCGYVGDDTPGLCQHFPNADVARIVVGLLNRDRAEGEFNGYVSKKFVHPLISHTPLHNVSF